MMRHLPKSGRRLAAIALLVGVIVGVGRIIVNPLVTHLADVREQIASERALLARFAALAAQEKEARELERRLADMSVDGDYLAGESEAIKLAHLQSLLTDTVATNGLRVHSARTLPARERGELRLVGVRIQLHAEIGPIQRTLHEIEAKRPFLFIEAVQISRFSRAEADETGAMLEAQLDVFGAVLRKRE
jgi:hypothetical protein